MAAAYLLELVAIAPGLRLLDVGTGTGAVPAALGERIRELGRLVGCDPSPAMLARARRLPSLQVVVADAARLPFPDDSFDLVTASFVLSHVPDYAQALREILRVLEKGSSCAVSNWGPASSPYEAAWRQLLEAAIGSEAVEEATQQVAPWDGYFSSPETLQAALAETGFAGVRVVARELPIRLSVDEFFASRELSSAGRFGRHVLGLAAWPDFRAQALAELRNRFGDQVSYGRSVLLAVGVKP